MWASPLTSSEEVRWRKDSYENSFHLVEGDFLGAAVVELRRACRGMVRHLRRFSERAAVLQISGDARRPKGVVADVRGEAGGFGAPLNHRIGIRLGQEVAGELAGRTAVSLEQHRLRLVREARAVK